MELPLTSCTKTAVLGVRSPSAEMFQRSAVVLTTELVAAHFEPIDEGMHNGGCLCATSAEPVRIGRLLRVSIRMSAKELSNRSRCHKAVGIQNDEQRCERPNGVNAVDGW